MHTLAAIGHQAACRIQQELIPHSISHRVSPPTSRFMPRRAGLILPTVKAAVGRTAYGYIRIITVWVDAIEAHLPGLERALTMPTEDRLVGLKIKKAVPLYYCEADGVALYVLRPHPKQYQLVVEQIAIPVPAQVVRDWASETEEGVY